MENTEKHAEMWLDVLNHKLGNYMDVLGDQAPLYDQWMGIYKFTSLELKDLGGTRYEITFHYWPKIFDVEDAPKHGSLVYDTQDDPVRKLYIACMVHYVFSNNRLPKGEKWTWLNLSRCGSTYGSTTEV
jgi:hypothetical protein